ncbi:MAG: ABC transporter permease [Lachnospiraceae bacterium]|nr:ABC transporter permease [Lachnospiraceae bacterium]
MILFLENVRLALHALRANKMRSLLTMLGIIIGISSVIAIMTVGNSLTASMNDSMMSMGANNITVYLQQREKKNEITEEGLVFKESGTGTAMAGDEDLFTGQMIENLCETYPSEIYAISVTETAGSGQITDERKYANVNISGVSVGAFVSDNITMLHGRFFSEKEMDEGLMLGIISDRAAENIFGDNIEDALGSIINVETGKGFMNLTVIGIYKYEQNSFSFNMGARKDVTTNLYIPLRTAKKLNHTTGYQSFTIVTQDGVNPDEFAATVKTFFKTYYRNNRNFEPAAFSLTSIVSTMSDMMDKITTAIAVVAGIALLVGGIGVMNIMLVSITERTREIGTRKALGAPNSSIRLQFIVEAVVICLIGGMIGIAIGIAGGMWAADLLNTPAKPSVFSIVLSLSFSMIIGVFFGYYPANKAAKMDPIEALRYE